MARRSQKEVERFLAREFLRGMGYRILRLASSENPDIFATVEHRNRRMQLGIELTDYYVDASPKSRKGSPICQLDRFWEEIKSSIRRRVARRMPLQHMTGQVFFKKKAVPRGRIAREMAREFVDLALKHPVARDEMIYITKFSEAYPLLQKYIRKVYLYGTECDIRPSWECGTTSAFSVGVVANYVIESISIKAEKAKGYDWKNANRRWLLICATGYPVASSAGPHPEIVAWEKSGMVATAKASGFDRVFLWDRARGWCKPLWPEKRILQI